MTSPKVGGAETAAMLDFVTGSRSSANGTAQADNFAAVFQSVVPSGKGSTFLYTGGNLNRGKSTQARINPAERTGEKAKSAAYDDEKMREQMKNTGIARKDSFKTDAGLRQNPDKAGEAAAEFEDEAKNVLTETFSVTEEELLSAMSVLGLAFADLTDTRNFTELAVELSGVDSTEALLMSEQFQTAFGQFGELVNRVADLAGVQPDALQELFSGIAVETEAVPEAEMLPQDQTETLEMPVSAESAPQKVAQEEIGLMADVRVLPGQETVQTAGYAENGADESVLQAAEPEEPTVQAANPEEPTVQSANPEELTVQVTEPEWKAVQAANPEEPTIQATEPERPTVQTAKPERPTIQATEPERPTVQVTEPERPTVQAANLEESTVQMTEPEEPTVQMTEPERPTVQTTEPERPTIQVAEPKEPTVQATEPEENDIQTDTLYGEEKTVQAPETAQENPSDSQDGQQKGTRQNGTQISSNGNNQVGDQTQNANVTVHYETVYDAAARQTVTTVTQTTVDVQSILEQFTQTVRIFAGTENSAIEMQLMPEHLGKVYLHVSEVEGQVRAQIAVQNEAVREAMAGQVAALKETLNGQGIKVEAVEVTIASHEFERNLEEGSQSTENGGEPDRRPQTQGRPNINLQEDGIDDGLMSQEEQLARRMMRDLGNTVDFTA